MSCLTGKYLIKPQFISLITTNRCNFRCESCYFWKKPHTDELNTEEWLKVIDHLAPILSHKTFVEINGGEALLNKNLVLKLTKELKKYKTLVALNSNGSLINQDTINQLSKANLDIIKISLYSHRRAVHDKLRGFKGAYDRAINAIKLISKSSISLEIGVLLTSLNISDIPKLLVYLRKNFPSVRIYLQPLDETIESPESKKMNSNSINPSLWPSRKESHSFFKFILNNLDLVDMPIIHLKTMQAYYDRPQSILKYNCIVGQKNVIIDPHGNISLCFKRHAVGNILEKNVDNILRGSIVAKERRSIQRCKKYCRIIGCNFQSFFP